MDTVVRRIASMLLAMSLAGTVVLVPRSAEAPLGAERALTNNPYWQRFPRIDGSYVVWADERNTPNPAGIHQDIYLYDLSLNQERRLTSHPSNETSPDVDGQRVVWSDTRDTDDDIFLLDLTTGEERGLVVAAGRQIRPRIDGDWVVWMDHRGADWDVWAMNLVSGATFAVVDWAGDQFEAEVDEGVAVWADLGTGEVLGDIYACTLANCVIQQITDEPAEQVSASIDWPWVAWTDFRNDPDGGPDPFTENNPDIYAFNFQTQTERAITTHPGQQETPAVGGQLIAWKDYRNEVNRHDDWFDSDAYVYDLVANQTFQVTAGGREVDEPAIDADRIVWTDWRNDIEVNGQIADQTNPDPYLVAFDRSGPNRPPRVDLEFPSDNAVVANGTPLLAWRGSDPDANELRYTLLVGPTADNLQSVASGLFLPFALTPPLANGTYAWCVTPNDGIVDGVCANGPWSFTVKIGAIAPTPRLAASTTSPKVGERITLSAADSSDDGTIVARLFDFGDGTPRSGWVEGDEVAHVYLKPGVYVARLKVRDNERIESNWAELVLDVRGETPTEPPWLWIGLGIGAGAAAFAAWIILRKRRAQRREEAETPKERRSRRTGSEARRRR